MRAASHVWVLTFLLSACGGSSSETPPPLEPDPDLLRDRSSEDGSDQAPNGGSPAGTAPAANPSQPTEGDGSEPLIPDSFPTRGPKGTPARSTWGNAAGGERSSPPELAPPPDR